MNRLLAFGTLTLILGALVYGPFSPGKVAHADVTPYSGGGEQPTPFSVPNRYVELADGESYDLIGQVVAGPAISASIPYGQQQAWFVPDFAAQPWLANAKRVASPGYPMVDALWYAWAPYAGQLIHLQVLAQGVVLNEQYIIFLAQDPNACADDTTSHKKHN
jgi:hypothetical protein